MWYIVVRNLSGKNNPGKAIITSASFFKRIKENRNDWIEYSVGPYKENEYEEALRDILSINKIKDF